MLAQFGQVLNGAGLLWGVGASAMLYRYGLVDLPNDIDIIVAEKDIEKADEILSSFGRKRLEYEDSDVYLTEYFYEYELPGLDVDLISGYKIVLPNGAYSYLFDEQSISVKWEVNGVMIPYSAIEEWYVLYQLMPNREQKVRLIETYFEKNGISYPDLLKRMLLQDCVPPDIVARTMKLLR
ncbi:hypothetical protein D0T56_07060 [Dysgonomonas sp. 520]|nr:hypothetical protein [Dysgonomonas sp. 520]